MGLYGFFFFLKGCANCMTALLILPTLLTCIAEGINADKLFTDSAILVGKRRGVIDSTCRPSSKAP